MENDFTAGDGSLFWRVTIQLLFLIYQPSCLLFISLYEYFIYNKISQEVYQSEYFVNVHCKDKNWK